MELRRDLRLALGVLLVLNLLLAFGSIGLFSRMGPAIDRILKENVDSIENAEQMLSILAARGEGDVSPKERAKFEKALIRIQNNITLPSEKPFHRTAETQARAALDGDPKATHEVIRALRSLIEVNRGAMNAINREAQRLGTAGAWAAVFVGSFSFWISLLVMRRMDRRILQPIFDLYQVLQDVRAGNQHRRSRQLDAPLEIRRVCEAVNHLLDHRFDATGKAPADDRTKLRTALLALLERESAPTILFDNDGRCLAANSTGLEFTSSPLSKSLGERLKASAPDQDQVAVDGLKAQRLPESAGWLCVYTPSTRNAPANA